jgi:alpha-1,4-galacturonosyltransferase
MKSMDLTIDEAKSCHIDCRNFERKLRQLVDLTEEETYFHMRQSAFLYHLGVQTVPKTHNCLTLRLTVEYFRSSGTGDLEGRSTYEAEDANLQHFVVLSTNVLAISVTVNSTAMHLKVCYHLCLLIQIMYRFFSCVVPNMCHYTLVIITANAVL